jgi:nitroreductase
MLPALTELIRRRRSIKPVDMDSGREVDRTLLVELIENATWAPNHGMTEPWKFHVFQGASRADLVAVLQQTYRETTAPAEFREDKFKKMGENPLLANVVIACVMERNGGSKIPEIEEIEALACAIQNLQLSATAAGLGCYWSSPPLLEAAPFREWLGLRSEDRCMGLIYLGWPKASLNWPRSVRQPVENRIVWH